MKDEHKQYPADRSGRPFEEGAPRFARTMGLVRWGLFGALSIFALVMVLNHFGLTPWAGEDAASQQYHCPMHPTYVSNQPGDCPICGMSLVPIATAGGKAETTYGNGESGSPEKEGAAPGKAETAPADSAAAANYVCPMHPEVVSDKPGRCPKCGMNLVESAGASGARRSEENDHAASDMGERPVPGLMPVMIEPKRLQMIGVRTAQVEKRSVGGAIRLVGYLTPDETRTASIHVRVSGWVQKLHVDQTGQQVKAGQPLLSLYSPDLYAAQQDLLLAEGSLATAGEDGALRAAREQLVAAARDRLELLGMSREDISTLGQSRVAQPEITLRSPFAGVVLEKVVREGQYVMPEERLLTIADLRRIWVLADVYEQDIAQVKIGQVAEMKLGAFPGENFDGKVAFLYPTVSEQTRTMKARIEFPNPSLRLRPGMYADIDLLEGGRAATGVPAEAIMDDGDIQYAFVVHGGTQFEPRQVTVGRRGNDWIEILTGLRDGETIVTSANFLIDSESRLKAAIAGMGQKQSPEHQH